MRLLASITCLLSTQIRGIPILDNGYKTYIVGGNEAELGQFPYIVQLQVGFYDTHYCGGAILSENWVITAAHCMDYNSSEYLVVAGQHNIELVEDSEQRRTIKHLSLHPKYDSESPANLRYDVALIELSSPFVFNNKVKSIPIHPDPFHETPVGTHAIVAGWGSLDKEGELYATVLNFAEIAIISHEKCKTLYEEYSYWYPILDSMICAGRAAGEVDSCHGDSGGPLVCSEQGQKYLCGIISFAIGCADKEFPGVNTKVSHFHDWITETMKIKTAN